MIHNTARGGHDEVSEGSSSLRPRIQRPFQTHHLPKLSGGEEVVGPLLHVTDGHVESGGDDAALVQPAGQVDDDLATPVVVDHFKLANVAVPHHDGEEPDDHLGAGSEQDLALAALLGVVDALQCGRK